MYDRAAVLDSMHAFMYFCSDSPWLPLSPSPGIWIRGGPWQVLWQMCSEEMCCYRARQQHTLDWGRHFETFKNLCFTASDFGKHLVFSVMHVVSHVSPSFCFPAQVNDTYIPPDDKCKQYTCEENSGVLVTKETVTTCPPFNPLDCEPVSVLNSYIRHPSAHTHTISHTTWHVSPSSRAPRQLMQTDAANPVSQQSHANKNKKSYASCGIDHLFWSLTISVCFRQGAKRLRGPDWASGHLSAELHKWKPNQQHVLRRTLWKLLQVSLLIFYLQRVDLCRN